MSQPLDKINPNLEKIKKSKSFIKTLKIMVEQEQQQLEIILEDLGYDESKKDTENTVLDKNKILENEKISLMDNKAQKLITCDVCGYKYRIELDYCIKCAINRISNTPIEEEIICCECCECKIL